MAGMEMLTAAALGTVTDGPAAPESDDPESAFPVLLPFAPWPLEPWSLEVEPWAGAALDPPSEVTVPLGAALDVADADVGVDDDGLGAVLDDEGACDVNIADE